MVNYIVITFVSPFILKKVEYFTFFANVKENCEAEIIIMKIVLILLLIFSIGILGYSTHVDAQTKKRQELMKVVHDAEHSLNEIQHSPHTNLPTLKQSH